MQYQANITGKTDVKVYAWESYQWQRISNPTQSGTRETPTEAYFSIEAQPATVIGTTTTVPAITAYNVATVDPPPTGSSSTNPRFSTTVGTGSDIQVPIIVTTTYDIYGYPLTASGVVESCAISSALSANGDKATSPNSCSLLGDGYSRTINGYNTNSSLQPQSRSYNIRNYSAIVAPNPSTQPAKAVVSIKPVPGIGSIYAVITVGSLLTAFYGNYRLNKSWANADSSGNYRLTIPLVDSLGNYAFDMLVLFNATTNANGTINLLPTTSLSFPELRTKVGSLLDITPSTPISVTLVLDNAGTPITYSGIPI